MCTANGFWTHSIQIKPVLSEDMKIAQQKKTNQCLQQPSPLSFSPHQCSLTIPGNLWLGSNYILGVIMIGMTCSQPTFPFLLPSWGKCRATTSRKGFRNTDHIHANINGATPSSENNMFPYKNAPGKNWQVLQETALVIVKSWIEDIGALLLQGLFFKKMYMIVTLIQN